MRTRILIADDHEVVIEGLRRILDRPEFVVVEAVKDGRALIAKAALLKPDVILTDISLPLLNGIEAARQIRAGNPTVKIIFLTMHREVAFAVEALAAAGNGYVLKDSAGEELVAAIGETLNGRVYVSPSIAGRVQRALEMRSPREEPPATGLTPRQREVLQLLAEGHVLKEIAARLNVSPRTVEFHKYRMMESLGVRTVAELVAYAVKNQMVV
jgi:DNA-binding NarL/FixJ family response regulator